MRSGSQPPSWILRKAQGSKIFYCQKMFLQGLNSRKKSFPACPEKVGPDFKIWGLCSLTNLGILPHCGDGQSLKYILLYSYPIMKVTGVYVANMYRHSHICINTTWNTYDCLNSV